MCKFMSCHGLSIGVLSLTALLSVGTLPALQDGAPPRPGGGAMPVQPVQPGQDRPRQPGMGQQAGPMLSFHDHMENAGRAFRGVGRAMRGAGAGEAADPAMLWRSLDMLQASLVGAKSRIEEVEMSEAAKAQYGEDTKSYQMAFRAKMLGTIKETLALEEALLKGDQEAAMKSAQALNEAQGQAHDMFKPREEGGGGAGEERPRRPGRGGGGGGRGGAGGGAGGGRGAGGGGGQ